MGSEYRDILRQFWNYDDFRGIQLDIIESIGSGRDTLGLMPTGGGKSIAFQVPALAMEGVCLVITPLIALMKDQVANLRSRGIKASAVYSGMSRREVQKTLDNSVLGGVKFLYVSPERLKSDTFQEKLSHINICFITIDEAHCISQWGYDFRPSYLSIADIRKLRPELPVLALTATATLPVVDDIQERLLFRAKNVFRMDFERKNLSYVVRKTENKFCELEHILSSVEGSAIVYVRSRKGTKEVSSWLSERGISALYYHAGLHDIDKDLRQKMWQDGECRVIVATNAFGMGIDKSDVRLVIHMDMPDSPEAYFQEAGRAGRDGRSAYAVLLYNKSDNARLSRRVADTFPEKDYIRKVYEHLAYFFALAMGDGEGRTYDFSIDKFCRTFKFFPVPVVSALKILSRAGYITYADDEERSSRVIITLNRNELYRLNSSNPDCDTMINVLLRSYAGLFSEYVFIDERDIASRTGFTPRRVYELLKNMSQQRILHYVPRRAIPCVTYLRNRVEASRMFFAPEIYEERKKQYEERIEAMLRYVEDDNTCRSKMLVEYFGQENAHDCMRCDVCLERKAQVHEADDERCKTVILKILSDGRLHSPAEIMEEYTAQENGELSMKTINRAISQLVSEELITTKDGFFRTFG